MSRRTMIAAAALVTLAFGQPALAQSAGPLSNREVIGDWRLTISPAERRDVQINIEIDDDDLPLTVRGQPTGRLTCTLRGDPADCRLRNGGLVVVMPTESGAARMVFTLTDRLVNGFGGAARVSMRFLPIGGHIGAVAMTRR